MYWKLRVTHLMPQAISLYSHIAHFQTIDLSSFKGQVFIIDLGSVEEAMKITGSIDDNALITLESTIDVFKNATASIYISEELLEHCFNDVEENVTQCFSLMPFFRLQTPQRFIHVLEIESDTSNATSNITVFPYHTFLNHRSLSVWDFCQYELLFDWSLHHNICDLQSSHCYSSIMWNKFRTSTLFSARILCMDIR